VQSENRVDIVGGFTIDAIIRADGTWSTGQLGGNALWASMGAGVLAGGAPVAHAVVGADYSPADLATIATRGIDVSGVRRSDAARNARVTFAYRPDGSRAQPAPAGAVAVLPDTVRPEFADTTRDPALTLATLPTAADLAPTRAARWHLGLLPAVRFAELVTGLRDAGAADIQVDCPARFELRRDGDAVLRDHLSLVDVFLPSSSDTDVFAPGVDHHDLVARFHEYGAPVVVMKRGADGALVSDARSGEAWAVPAYPVGEHLDATGAGDVFCGTFATARAAGLDLLSAAVEASAYATYALDAASPLDLAAPATEDLAQRIARVREGVTPL
jgi:sugar/nucleoside kinase (ribokinase family)